MEVVASIVGEAVVGTGRVLCGSIYSAIKNSAKFQSNLDVLEKEMKSFMALIDEVKNETELAEKEGKVLRRQVTVWLKEVEELQLKVNTIQAVQLSPHSLNFGKQYRISRTVAELLKERERLLKAGSSHTGNVAVNYSAPRAVEHIPGPSIQDQTTASGTLAYTMTLLSDPRVRRIGIWGMGGIGKTTLVRHLNNELKSTSMQPFSIVIWAAVSKNFDIKRVQREIAERLNLPLEESPERMAIQLYRRLEEEKFLLILDDVWEQIDLDILGVPPPEVLTGSKIILTSRFLNVCRDMLTDIEIKINVLNEEAAWQLFSRHAGNVVSSEHIRPCAEAIARECDGLPLAIITMGAAMRGKTMVRLWKDALKQLQRSVPYIAGIEDKVYKPLKWSYDSLEGRNIKLSFLYCSLFPEDFSIETSELVESWLAEGLIDEQENYEDSVNRGIALIESLKDSCLLEDGTREGTVKMHDVVRDVAIWIASSSEDGCKSLVRAGIGLREISAVDFSISFKRVSFMKNSITWLPDCVIHCSEASTLLLQGNRPLRRVPHRFLLGFEALRVLNMSGTGIRSLPLSLLQLVDLRALLLRNCFFLEELPPLERLRRLEIVDLCTTRIRELPRGMEHLSNLRQLNLSWTNHLKSVQGGVISRLSCLEVLDMSASGYNWRVRGAVEEEHTCFEELRHLERLLVLSIRLKRIPRSSEDLSWINRLRRFQFFIGPKANSLFPTRDDQRWVGIVELDLSGKCIGWLLRNASSLFLNYCRGLNEMLEDLVINSVGCFAGLRSLTFANYNSSLRPRGGCAAHYDLLPNLEELHFQHLTCVESISELVGHLGLRFLRLKLIEVTGCSQMKDLLSCGFFIHTLPNLEVIHVSFCDELDKLFNYHSTQNMVPDPVVPNLRILELKELPKLRTLCRHEETWPCLEQVDVINCNLLRKLPLCDQNADIIKEIRGELQWWSALEWDADTTKSSLQPYFRPA